MFVIRKFQTLQVSRSVGQKYAGFEGAEGDFISSPQPCAENRYYDRCTAELFVMC